MPLKSSSTVRLTHAAHASRDPQVRVCLQGLPPTPTTCCCATTANIPPICAEPAQSDEGSAERMADAFKC